MKHRHCVCINQKLSLKQIKYYVNNYQHITIHITAYSYKKKSHTTSIKKHIDHVQDHGAELRLTQQHSYFAQSI